MEFHLVQNRKENCHRDHIPFNVRGNGNIILSVQRAPISRIAVRETGVSRHHRGPIEGLPETPRTSQHYHIEGINYVKGNGNLVFSAYTNCATA